MTAAFYTLGCKVNQYETQELLCIFKSAGYTIVLPHEKADLYIINTCTVTAESSRKSRQAVRRIRTLAPDAVIVVTGCYTQAFAEQAKELTEADIITGTRLNCDIPAMVEKYLKDRERTVRILSHVNGEEFKGTGIDSFDGHTRAFVKIQDGCNRRCSYCIIPEAKGFSRSKDMDSLKDELRKLSDNGYKEIVFTGINLSDFGRGTEHDLGDAVLLASSFSKIERIRLGSLEPDHITNELLKKFLMTDKFCPQFHLSLQSGSDRILKKMNRHYTSEEYSQICEKIRRLFPGSWLTTDVIAGFPGETDSDFEETKAFIRRISFEKVHIFPYSRREGTPAASMPEQITNKVKEERCAQLEEECKEIRLRAMQSLIGKNDEVLFERPENGYQSGYTKSYVPVLLSSETALTGKTLPVRIISVNSDSCFAELL